MKANYETGIGIKSNLHVFAGDFVMMLRTDEERLRVRLQSFEMKKFTDQRLVEIDELRS